MTKSAARVFSGIQPTGASHIGNYLGAIQSWVERQSQMDTLLCIVDYHATTIEYAAADMRRNIFELAVDLLASGIDPDQATLFVQSMVPEHTELAWILSTVTMFGDLGRMTQFKDKSDQHQHNVNVGLFTYPVLQAADILLYKAVVVPVGEDQVQHLELSRDIAKRFNRRFKREVFPRPKPLLAEAKRILGTDGQAKMSKSKGNELGLTESREARWDKLKRAVTDTQRVRRDDPGRPEVCNVFTWHGFFSSDETRARVDRECRTAGIGCADCKKLLDDSMELTLGPIREAAEAWRARPDDVWDVLKAGGRKARAIARETMAEVRELMGLPGAVE